MVVSPCLATGAVSGVQNNCKPARTLKVSECTLTAVPAEAIVVLLTSAANPAAGSAESTATGVAALPPEPPVACPRIT
jgi:hypothetical protein